MPGSSPNAGPVTVSRNVLAGLIAALLAALLLITFLLGRGCAPPAPQIIVSTPPAAGAAAPVAASEAAPIAPTAPIEAASPPATATSYAAPTPASASRLTPPAAADAVAPAIPRSPASSRIAPLPDAAEVAAYFREMEVRQAQAKDFSDPQALAGTLVKQAFEGDASGFDRLLADNRKLVKEIREMNVPAPCKEHQRATLDALADAEALLARVRTAAIERNADGLSDLPDASRALEVKTREADALAQSIKGLYGL